jgi:hypothetical protein
MSLLTKITQASAIQYGDYVTIDNEKFSVTSIEDDSTGREIRLLDLHGRGHVKFFSYDQPVILGYEISR